MVLAHTNISVQNCTDLARLTGIFLPSKCNKKKRHIFKLFYFLTSESYKQIKQRGRFQMDISSEVIWLQWTWNDSWFTCGFKVFVCLYYFFQFGRSRRMWLNECFSPVTFPHPIWNEWKDTLGNLRLKHTSAFTHHQVYSQQDQRFNRQYVMLSVSLMESCNDWLH